MKKITFLENEQFKITSIFGITWKKFQKTWNFYVPPTVKFIKEKKQQIPINKVQHKRETITNKSSKYKTSSSNLNMRLNTYVIATKLISLKSDEFHTKIDAVFAPNSLRSRELWSFRSALQSYTIGIFRFHSHLVSREDEANRLIMHSALSSGGKERRFPRAVIKANSQSLSARR